MIKRTQTNLKKSTNATQKVQPVKSDKVGT